MILNKNDLKLFLKSELYRNGFSSYGDYLVKFIYGNDNARAVRYLRTLRNYEYYINTNHFFLKHLLRYRFRRLSLRYNISIKPNTVDHGLWIPHTQGGIIINCEKMGCNCTVTSGVVVGDKGPATNVATIGNNVELTLGCKVLGKITIGDNVIVAPNSVVVKDVPSNAVVSGVPAILIKLNGEKC